MDISEPLNAAYIDAQYIRWKDAPDALSRDWQFFFEGFERGRSSAPRQMPPAEDTHVLKQARVQNLIDRYRSLGHLLACLDPLTACPSSHPLLELPAVGLTPDDLKAVFFTPDFGDHTQAPLGDIVAALKETYCRTIGVEYMHLQDPDERRWLQERMEPTRNRPRIDTADRLRILTKLQQSVIFEQFLNRKYIGQTRFSLEGADVLIPMLDALVEHAAHSGVCELILGMAHRGRLNVQANILAKPVADIFGEFETCYNPDSLTGAGDVKYHNGYLADIETADGHPLRCFLVNNPSHLESVDPVVEGVARARQEVLQDAHGAKVLPLLIHGDAAFAGQGIVAETLNLSQLAGYATGGSIHVVINNQIGYTTLPEDARSTRYATDVAKMLMVPIFHVHGENPEAAVHVIRLAAAYRRRFGKDVVIDLVCYRRYGHNEGDEPYFTQPLMYSRIKERPPVSQLYTDKLVSEGLVQPDSVRQISESILATLEETYNEVHGSACPFPFYSFYEAWQPYENAPGDQTVKTAVSRTRLSRLAEKLATLPEGFALHPKLQTLMQKRLQCIRKGSGIDWANAEQLAFATLLAEGTPVRLSGQDSQRGTFSQRHSVLVDTGSGNTYTPLNHLADGQAIFSVHNSMLAEISVLSFEYGYAMVRPETLVMWEAQFGDFVNNAQSAIDLYIASGEEKWQRKNGLVMLLPHGLEGLGPEHSSARPERFLQLCAAQNMQVCNPTTPAQYFHLLRRQIKRPLRKPLVVLTPKSLLRHPLAVSAIEDLSQGTFQPVIDEPKPAHSIRRVLLCSGKIYYELHRRRQELQDDRLAIVRIEELYPFPENALKSLQQRYPKAAWCWVQEEPRNMGAWHFMALRLQRLGFGNIDCISRPASPSPASGFPNKYRLEQAAILDAAVGKRPDGSIS